MKAISMLALALVGCMDEQSALDAESTWSKVGAVTPARVFAAGVGAFDAEGALQAAMKATVATSIRHDLENTAPPPFSGAPGGWHKHSHPTRRE